MELTTAIARPNHPLSTRDQQEESEAADAVTPQKPCCRLEGTLDGKGRGAASLAAHSPSLPWGDRVASGRVTEGDKRMEGHCDETSLEDSEKVVVNDSSSPSRRGVPVDALPKDASTSLLKQTDDLSSNAQPTLERREEQVMSNNAEANAEAVALCVDADRDPDTITATAASPTGDDSGNLESFGTRIRWLIGLLLFQSIAGNIIEGYDAMIKKHPVVVYFLTMLVGAGGNAGSQSSVIVIRGLATGQMSAAERWAVVLHQLKTGFGLALCLTAVSFVRIYFFETKGAECLAICLSIFIIVLTSVVVGTVLPFGLLLLGADPAHAGAAIQVIMDIGGVLLTCAVSYLILGEGEKLEQAVSAPIVATQDPEAMPLVMPKATAVSKPA